MTNANKIKRLEEALKTGKRITKQELCELAEKAESKGEHFDFLIKVDRNAYAEWLDQNSHLNADDELVYLANTNSKMFQRGKCGYSLFAQSIGEMKREDNGMYNVLDRLEHTPWQFAIVLV